MKFPRSSGVLLHPTSLPGRFGLGTLGDEAHRFVDYLAESGQRYWQVLPLGPTSYGDSPYQSLSAFAGNPMLVDLEQLVQDGWLTAEDLSDVPAFPEDKVDYGWVIPYKAEKLRKAFEGFEARADLEERQRFEGFCRGSASWLADFALFMALKEHFDGTSWAEWEPALRDRKPEAVTEWHRRLEPQVRYHAFVQYLFFSQYTDLKRYAAARGVQIIGDLPIFVAYDSADAWSNPEIFHFDTQGHPTVVAGVPPDYFSETGQLWGNPLYRWEVLAKSGYAWWIERLKMALTLYDVIRVDHFRGFEAYWEIPAGEETAVNGRWVKGPDRAFFDALKRAFGDLPIIAEDLGVITPEVEALRDGAGLPGMKILQFAFGSDADNAYLPHNYKSPNCVVYTGTHDNDTTEGFFAQVEEKEREHLRAYIGSEAESVSKALIRMAFASVADLAIIPVQDWLGLGAEARMNVPGQAVDNWAWRVRSQDLDTALSKTMRELSELYGRAKVRVAAKVPVS
ncbi:4-alpha-glucanotransferase [bacterium]|nr:4-alpha-glucanotransferase [bacterium]